MRNFQRIFLASTVGACAMWLQTADSREHALNAVSSRVITDLTINLAQAPEPGAPTTPPAPPPVAPGQIGRAHV